MPEMTSGTSMDSTCLSIANIIIEKPSDEKQNILIDDVQQNGLEDSSSQASLNDDNLSNCTDEEYKDEPNGHIDQIDEEAGCDTDLEIEDEKTDYNYSGAKIYLETCQELGVVPASYFVRHMQDDHLVMRHHGLGPLGAKALAIPLVTNTYVISLDLQDNWIEGEGARPLAEMLKENCYIAHLTISDNRLGSEGAIAMCDMLQANSSLTDLNLSGNGFTDKDAPYFAEAILTNSLIRELNLSRNEFGPGAGAILGHALGENETIEKLDLSWNHFRGRAALDIVEGIKVNSRLKRVNLSWNGLGNEGAVAVAECLKFNHVLTQLDISNNRMTIEGISMLAKALDVNETLTVLKIGQNAIGNLGALLILQSVNNERSILEELDLTDICVDKEFDKLHQEMLQSRQLNIIHGGVLGNFAQKIPPKKKGNQLDEQELAALRALEEFLQNDPMVLLKAHVKKKNLRLVDLFKEIDKNKDCKINAEDLKRHVKQKGLDLPDDKVDQLVDRLEKTKDGHIDYTSLAFKSTQTVHKQRRLSRVIIDTFESTGRTSIPSDMSFSPALKLIDRRLLNLNVIESDDQSGEED